MAPIKSINQPMRLRRVQWHDHDGQVVIFDSTARTIALNPTAALLWRHLVDGADREQLVQDLMAEFGIEEMIAVHDVDGFLDGLKSRGLLAEAV
jgi:hypothetical protein